MAIMARRMDIATPIVLTIKGRTLDFHQGLSVESSGVFFISVSRSSVNEISCSRCRDSTESSSVRWKSGKLKETGVELIQDPFSGIVLPSAINRGHASSTCCFLLSRISLKKNTVAAFTEKLFFQVTTRWVIKITFRE